MASLTGTQIANTYKQLLQVGSGNVGLTSSLQTVQDGDATNSPLQLSDSAVNINGTFQLSGVTLTASASTLNAVADLTGATGLVAVSAGNVYGRSLVAGTGITIGNADGTEGNPTIAMVTAATSGSYKGPNDIEVNAVGQIVSISPAVSVSVATIKSAAFEGGTFVGSTGGFSSNVSIGNDLVVSGDATLGNDLVVSGDATFQRITVSAFDLTRLSATSGEFSGTVSAGFFVGDGSGLINVPSAEGGTMKFITAGTGINFTVNGVTSTTIPVSGTVNLNTNQSFGIVSATNIDADELLMAGVSAANVTEVAAVSVLTKTNLDAITSINAVIGDGSGFATDAELAAVSATMATSINNSNTRITSVSDFAVALSATMATSINNSNTNITTNADAITSINSVVANVSALTSVNADAITSINSVIGDGSGFVVGPVAATDNAVARFDATTGKLIQNSGVIIDDSGNLLVGTTSPTTDLGYLPKLKLSGNGPGLYFEETDTSQDYSISALGGKFYIRDATAVATRLTMDSSGNVGIGTTVPDNLLHLFISSTTQTASTDSQLVIERNSNSGLTILSGNTTSGHIFFGDSGDNDVGQITYNHNSNYMQFTTNASEAMRIDSSGNVGIGTSSPAQFVQISKVTSGGTTGLLVSNPSGAGGTSAALKLGVTSEDDTVAKSAIIHERLNSYGRGDTYFCSNFAADTTEVTDADAVITIQGSSKNVGIGTTSPASKLDVNGAAVLSAASTETRNFGIGSGRTGNGYAYIDFIGDATYSTYGLRILRGNTGANTGTAITHRGTGLFTITTFDAATIQLKTSNAERMRISSTGNVGIGTTAPAKQLSITKSALATINTLTDGATITPDFDAGQNFSVTLAGNRTLANPTNIDAGQTGSIFITQDGTGGRTLSFGSYWDFAGGTAPTLSTAAGAVDRIDYIVRTGTSIHAIATLNLS